MFELRILNGLHQGAALPLIGEQWLIGSDASQDLVLNDPGVALLHCRLQRTGEGWILNADGGEVFDDHGHTVTTLELNSNFTLGSVWLCLAAAEDAWPTSLPGPDAVDHLRMEPSASIVDKSVRSRVFNRVSGVIAGMLIGIAGSAWSLTRAPSFVSESSTPSPITITTPTSLRIHLANADDVRRQLNIMLNERMLNDISVQQTPAGMTVNGNVRQESLLVYQRMLQRFKDTYDSPLALIDNVSTSRIGLPFVIIQIMSGPHAHLVTSDGHRLYVGDELQGLRLTRIDDSHVEFDGERHYELTW